MAMREMRFRSKLLFACLFVVAGSSILLYGRGVTYTRPDWSDTAINRDMLEKVYNTVGARVNVSDSDAGYLMRKMALQNDITIEDVEEVSEKSSTSGKTVQEPIQNRTRSSLALPKYKRLLQSDDITSQIENTLNHIKVKLLEDISNESFPNILSTTLQGRPISGNLKSLPKKIVIVSTWRSGSTFLEELISSHKPFFDFYEPLIMFEMTRVREGEHAELAQEIIKNLLECRYQEKTYLRALDKVDDLSTRNKYLYEFCISQKHRKKLCKKPQFLSAACHLFPWKLMKLVRLKLSLMEPFLEDSAHSDLQIIFLVRDPRAVMNSRRSSVSWCSDELDDCSSPSSLCQDMQEDLKSAIDFKTKYPDRVHILRYEDLMFDPEGVSNRLFEKLGLEMTSAVATFLEDHTKSDVDSPWSTTRNSKKRLLYWTQKTKETDLNEIQEVCHEAMTNFGYNIVRSLRNLTMEDVIHPMNDVVG